MSGKDSDVKKTEISIAGFDQLSCIWKQKCTLCDLLNYPKGLFEICFIELCQGLFHNVSTCHLLYLKFSSITNVFST